MSADPTARAELTARQLPCMTLSTASNPLTAPLPPLPESLSPAERAAARFAVHGNAVITGGSGALALATARALLEHGLSKLCLMDVSHPAEAAAGLVREFPNAQVLPAKVDVRDAAGVEQAMNDAKEKMGSVDMLLCFAGVVGAAHSVDFPVDDWRRLIDVNTTGSWLCAQAAGKHMIALGTGGSILLTASISAHRTNFPQPQAAYNASKAALLALKSSLAAEWARYGIRVNSISPGYMDTILNEGEGLEVGRSSWMQRNPMGRMGAPDEVAGVAVMICAQRAGRYVNGADFVVDGGGTVF
ncbi:hypothetical protein PLICRDRAFT_54961 [Plicaturopsis crispa FD-325 SS-3]|nr:hypothetical protein PLICRDRAFT_54961 [Plicaturopsis crispa FD-325 SS-3]